MSRSAAAIAITADARGAAAPKPPVRRKIKELEAMVADVVVETPDAATLVLFTGNERLEYEPGHFLLVHVVAGSGSVPNYSILKHALEVYPHLRHTFIHSSKTWPDVVFRRSLADLRERHPDRLRVVHTLTREECPERHGRDVRAGRLTADLLRELIPDPTACLVYACGPAIGPLDRAAARERGETPRPKFLETAVEALNQIGVSADRVKTESYG